MIRAIPFKQAWTGKSPTWFDSTGKRVHGEMTWHDGWEHHVFAGDRIAWVIVTGCVQEHLECQWFICEWLHSASIYIHSASQLFFFLFFGNSDDARKSHLKDPMCDLSSESLPLFPLFFLQEIPESVTLRIFTHQNVYLLIFGHFHFTLFQLVFNVKSLTVTPRKSGCVIWGQVVVVTGGSSSLIRGRGTSVMSAARYLCPS